MQAKEVFQRYEIKYIIPFSKYTRLTEALIADEKMRFDKFGDGQGRYNIVSLYFDSEYDDIYYETRNKLRFRQKLRLRVYDQASLESPSFLEIKQKFNNVVNKRRTQLKLADAYEYLNCQDVTKNLSKYQPSNHQVMKEADNFRHLYGLKPCTVVSYDRQALHGIADEDLRVTFDYNLMYRKDNLRIEDGPEGDYLADPQQVIMEVKVSQSVPYWLSGMLSDFNCSRQSFSKFCTSIELAHEQEKRNNPSADSAS